MRECVRVSARGERNKEKMRERKERENEEEKERLRVRARLKERDIEGGGMLHSHVEQFSDKDLNVRAESDSQQRSKIRQGPIL